LTKPSKKVLYFVKSRSWIHSTTRVGWFFKPYKSLPNELSANSRRFSCQDSPSVRKIYIRGRELGSQIDSAIQLFKQKCNSKEIVARAVKFVDIVVCVYANPLTWHGFFSIRCCLISDDDDDSAMLLQNAVEFTSKRFCDGNFILSR